MDITKSIMNYLKAKGLGTNSNAPEGICPNCWGRQEWDGQIYDKIKEQGIDIKDKKLYSSFIKEFVNRYLEPIVINKVGSTYVCRTCNSK